MSALILDESTIRVLDDLFSTAQESFDNNDFSRAYSKCDDIKRLVEKVQRDFVKAISKYGIAVGAIGGLVFPGVGNLVGGIVGGFAGRWISKIVAEQAVCVYESIKELAITGKLEAKVAQRREEAFRSGAPIDITSYSSTERRWLLTRWERIRKEVFGT